MPLTRYAIAELTRFLVALDHALDVPATIVVVGGSAIVLRFGGDAATADIDTFESDLDGIAAAAVRARAETGLSIPITNSGIAQLPPGFDARLERVLPELARLEVLVVERHDLATSKLLRGNDHDRQQLAQLHGLAPLDLPTLVERFVDLLGGSVGDPAEPTWALRHLIEELWGELDAVEAEAIVRSRWPRRASAE